VQFSASDSSIVSVNSEGLTQAHQEGYAFVRVTARGIEGVNMFTVNLDGDGPLEDVNGFEVDVYPRAVTLPLMGQRQLKVTSVDGEPISAAATGTQYFVSDATIAEVTADGLIRGKALGTARVTIVHEGMQHIIDVVIKQPEVSGPAVVPADGGVVAQDTQGNMVMVPPGALPPGATVSIDAVPLDSLGMPLPAPDILQSYAAFKLDFDGLKADLPLQVAVKLNPRPDLVTGEVGLPPAGSKVLFWLRSKLLDDQGVEHDTWWLVDNGYVDAEGIARTSSPPYAGIGRDGTLIITGVTITDDEETGEKEYLGVGINTDLLWDTQREISMSLTERIGTEIIGIFSV